MAILLLLKTGYLRDSMSALKHRLIKSSWFILGIYLASIIKVVRMKSTKVYNLTATNTIVSKIVPLQL